MQELSHLQLIESFKSFITACQISMKMPQEFERKWLIFSHYLNIYPLHSIKLTEYSHKCADQDLEKKFIQENLLQFSNSQTNDKDFTPQQVTPQKENNQPSQKQEQSETKSTSTRKSQKTLQTLSASIKVTIQKMRNGTKFFKDRIIETRRANNIDQSTTSVIFNETFKRVDANSLRQKIIVLKDDLKKQQEEEKRILQLSPYNKEDINPYQQSGQSSHQQLSSQKINMPQSQGQQPYQQYQSSQQQSYQYQQQQQNLYQQQQNRQMNYASQPQMGSQNRQQLINNQQQRMILQQNRQVQRQPMPVYPHQSQKQVTSRIVT